MNQRGTFPNGVRTSTVGCSDKWVPTRRNWMASDVPRDCPNASSVCCGLADDRNALLSASAINLADRVGGSFSSINWVVAKKWREAPPRIRAAANIAPSGRNSRVRRESPSHIRAILIRMAGFSLFKRCQRLIYGDETRDD